MPRPSDAATRVGDVGEGPSGLVDRAGSVSPLGASGPVWSAQWWIGGEDRWHVPSDEPSCRQRAIDSMPVLETIIKVPSGDAIARCYGAVLAGSDRRGVVVDVENASPVPFAAAFVVVSDDDMTTDGTSVWIDGVAVVQLTRPAARFAYASTPEQLRLALDGERFLERPTGAIAGVLALILPVPHTTSLMALVDPRPPARARRTRDPEPTVEPFDRVTAPSATQVASGWNTFVSRGVRLEGLDDASVAAFDAARADVLMGPEPTADARDLAAVATATARLGWLDEIGEVIAAVVDSQKLDGRIDSADPLDATTRFLAATAALWSAGVDADRLEALIGPIAKAGHWLGRGRRRPPLPIGSPAASAASAALHAITPALVAIDQAGVAADLRAFAVTLADGDDATDANAADTGDAADGPTSPVAGLTASADLVIAAIDAAVAETAEGLDVFGGWTPASLGASLEAHRVPTRWGIVSVAMRWHGERPA